VLNSWANPKRLAVQEFITSFDGAV
jgi:hypothetical protein